VVDKNCGPKFKVKLIEICKLKLKKLQFPSHFYSDLGPPVASVDTVGRLIKIWHW